MYQTIRCPSLGRQLSLLKPAPRRGGETERIARARADVLIDAEEVRRIVAVLEFDEPRVGVRAVSVAHAIVPLLTQEIDVHAARNEPPQLTVGLVCPGLMYA